MEQTAARSAPPQAAPASAPQPRRKPPRDPAGPIVIRPDGTVNASDRRRLGMLTGVDEQYIYQCMTGRKQLEPTEAIRFEAITGVPRWLMRQADWWLIWPEVIDVKGSPVLNVPSRVHERLSLYRGMLRLPPPRTVSVAYAPVA